MAKDEDFKLLKIQTCVLKVNIHCDGCKQKVKKLLQRIEGVYQVKIDADQQKVTVAGSVESATLIKKLIRAGKHAELWSQKGNNSQKPNQNQKQKSSCSGDDKKNKAQKQQGDLIKGLEALNNQEHKFHGFGLEDDEDYCFEDEFDEDDEEEGDQLRFLLRQAALDANNARKSGVGANGKMNDNGGKKGNPNQNVGIDPKAMAALKLNNPHLGAGGNVNPGEARRANDVNSLMGLAGFHGNGGISNSNSMGVGGGGGGGFQIQPNCGFQFQPSSSSGFPSGGLHLASSHHPSAAMMNMNGFQQQYNNNNNHPSALMMRNGHGFQQQIPQMMYQRSPYIPPSTGYYSNSNYSSLPYPYYFYPQQQQQQPNYGTHNDQSSASHMFSDENTSSCLIM